MADEIKPIDKETYYSKNKDKIRLKRLLKLGKINDINEEYSKEYKWKNNEANYFKEYYNNHKNDKFNSKEKKKCEICECEVLKRQYVKHTKSQKHQTHLKYKQLLET